MLEPGAKALAGTIEAVWRAVGYDNVRCHVEPTGILIDQKMTYQVRSNLINGLPPQ